jgi:predicted Zn finger-like uncharacterized protein
MIEIQCTSCQTRYRIDERILPEDTPTFKCSRCGHVFSAEPRPKPPRRAGAEGVQPAAAAKSAPSSATDAAQAPPPAGAEEPASPPAPPRQPPAAEAAAAAPVAPAQTPRLRQAGGASRRAASQPPTEARTAEPPRAAAPSQREELSPVRHDARELLQRRFRDIPADESDKPGENLAFDFNDEMRSSDAASDSDSESSSHGYPEDKWEVGNTEIPPAPQPRPKRRLRISDIDDDLGGDSSPTQSIGRTRAGEPASDEPEEPDFDRIRPEEVSAQAHWLEAELRGRSYKLHSAGYFIGLFALVILGFGIVTIVIQSAPVASAGLLSGLPIVGEGLEPPISPARRVALAQVQAQYLKLKGNQSALVITGTAENLTAASLGAVQIEAALTGSGPEPLRSQAVYCGNNLSSKMLGEMTPHEIEFFERLDAPKTFTLAPQSSVPFAIVFVAPPAGAAHFQLRIIRADPAATPPPATEGG